MLSSFAARPLSLCLAAALTVPFGPGGTAFAAGAVDAAPAPGSPGDPAAMTPEQKLEKAKQLFGEGNAALEAGDAVTALARFEDAYFNYTPERHKFNFNIGVAAYAAGDCVKAKAAWQRFLDLVPEDPNRGEAQLKILEIERSGCANVAPTTTTPTPTTSAPVDDGEDDAPILTSRRNEREDVIERERDHADAKRTHPMVIAGAVLTGVGAGLTVGGIVSAVLANRTANKLADLASPGPTGFPGGNYADDEVFDLDRNKLKAQNTAYLIMLPLGGVLLVSGVVVLAIGAKKQKQLRKSTGADGGGNADSPPADARLPRARFVGGGPTLLKGGAGVGATLKF